MRNGSRRSAKRASGNLASLAAIVMGAVIIVPTACRVRLKLPHLRPLVEFVCLLPLIVPGVVLVFGYIRLFGSNSCLPLTSTGRASISCWCSAMSSC